MLIICRSLFFTVKWYLILFEINFNFWTKFVNQEGPQNPPLQIINL